MPTPQEKTQRFEAALLGARLHAEALSNLLHTAAINAPDHQRENFTRLGKQVSYVKSSVGPRATGRARQAA